MKTLCTKLMVLMLLGVATTLQAQNREEVPGDNFSLEGALELFKKSSSPEEFERLLNLPESEVNNLDLNGDGRIDYIRVIDRHEGNIHTFTLQAVISRTEFQDIAVISLEKLADGRAILQITGDADIYGIETIIEPTREVRVNAGTTTTYTYVNVWSWPCVQYIYSPAYAAWVSPWYWDYTPIWWNPWRPVTYVVYYPRWTTYRPFYRHCDAPRIRYASTIYYPHRSASIVVYNRHRDQLSTYRSTRTVYGQTRGRDSQPANYNRTRTQRDSYGDRTRSTSDGNRNTSPGRNGRTITEHLPAHDATEPTRERTNNTGWQRREENRTETQAPRNRSVDAPVTNTPRSFERTNSSPDRTNRAPEQNSRPVFERPRSENQSTPQHRPENRQPETRPVPEQRSSPAVSPPQHRNSESAGNKPAGTSGTSNPRRGRD
ncbi:MAG: hypothetical protein J0L66_11045 [Cytophagales bacterium]|nr:hypothetical protein [Cytophagales bacterium]